MNHPPYRTSLRESGAGRSGSEQKAPIHRDSVTGPSGGDKLVDWPLEGRRLVMVVR